MFRLAVMTLVSLTLIAASSSDAHSQDVSRPFFGVAIRNSVLENRFARQRNEQEPVSKSLMNTNVTGSQTTVTETRLRIVPDGKSLRFELLNSGDVVSKTTGVNRQALIDSVGNHHFDITKPMWFDGSTFLTQPGYGTIRASQTPQRVVSAAGAAMPLLSRFGDRVAWNQVMRKSPQINQAVAEDVSRDVLPKVDRIVDEDFAKLGREWKAIQQQTVDTFRRNRLKWAARSTDDIATIWALDERSVDANSDVQIPRQTSSLRNGEEIIVFLSEGTVGSLVSQYFPAGLKLNDTQLQKLHLSSEDGEPLEQLSAENFGTLISAIGSVEVAEPTLFTLEFARDNPIELRFVEGDLRLSVTFQIHPKVGVSSGWMTTTFNMEGKRLPDDKWTIAVRNVTVGENAQEAASVVDDSSTFETDSLTIPTENDASTNDVKTVEAGTAWMPIIRSAADSIAKKMPQTPLPMEFDLPTDGASKTRLRLVKIDSANGMLRVALKIVDRPSVASSAR